jgi:hypothetical protein
MIAPFASTSDHAFDDAAFGMLGDVRREGILRELLDAKLMRSRSGSIDSTMASTC